MQQHNAASQVPSQLHYSTVTVQPTNRTQHGQHHVSTSPSSNDVHTHVDTTRSLPYPVCDNTTTVTNLPYPTSNNNVHYQYSTLPVQHPY